MGRPESVERVLFDASCLIGVIKGEPAMQPLQSLLRAIEAGSVTVVESTAILAEVLPTHQTGDPQRRQAILELLESSAVDLVDVSTVIARRAADLRMAHGLKTWDAIHLATGLVAQVDVVFVRDSRFPTGQTIDGVYVSEPFDVDDDKLPFKPG